MKPTLIVLFASLFALSGLTACSSTPDKSAMQEAQAKEKRKHEQQEAADKALKEL